MVSVFMKKFILCHIALFGMLLVSADLVAKPPNIKPGLSYYSEDYDVSGNQYVLAEERNLEEVFKNYRYYEAVYDEQERIKIFKAYKRGEIEFTEAYFYDKSGRLVRKLVTDADNKEEVVELAPQ